MSPIQEAPFFLGVIRTGKWKDITTPQKIYEASRIQTDLNLFIGKEEFITKATAVDEESVTLEGYKVDEMTGEIIPVVSTVSKDKVSEVLDTFRGSLPDNKFGQINRKRIRYIKP